MYFRAYNGESLCAECFNESIFEKVKKTISKYEMLRYGDRIGVAVSGGKDSTSLLYILSDIMKGHGSELVALTIDEGIEGYREESIRNAEKVAADLSVPLEVGSYKELFGVSLDEAMHQRDERHLKATSCSICGPLRRRAIDTVAGKAAGYRCGDSTQSRRPFADILHQFVFGGSGAHQVAASQLCTRNRAF